MDLITKNPKQDIKSCLRYLHSPGNTFEIRLKGIKINKSILWDNVWTSKIVSGYFNNYEMAADAIIKAEQVASPELIMVSINSCPNDFLSRANNRFKANCTALKESDIEYIDNIVFDFDPVRKVSGVSATDKEKAYAQEKAMQFSQDAIAGGLPEPYISDSGNGIHVAMKLPNLPRDKGYEIVECLTKIVADHYTDDFTIIDTSMTSPAHMVKVTGTMSCKGENMPDRPHRRSRIISLPKTIVPIPQEKLYGIVQQSKTETTSAPETTTALVAKHGQNKTHFDLELYLSHYNKQVIKTIKHGDAILHVLDQCLFDPSHTTAESAIGQRDDGTLFYHCFHTSCNAYRWSDAKQQISGSDSLQPFIKGGNLGFEPLVGTVVSMQELISTDFPPTIPLIENVIGVGGATVISGPGGLGKSNLTLNMALALGSPGVTKFLDLTVADQVNSLIIQAENAASDTKDRLKSMIQHPGFNGGVNQVFSPTHKMSDIRILGCDFNDDKFISKIIDDITTTNAGLLIVDPLISFHKGDENDNSGMRRTLDRLTEVMVETGVAIILVHHVGRVATSSGSSYAGRGASAVGDWCHNSFLLKTIGTKNNTLELSCQKARNFKKPDPIQMQLNSNLVFERVYQQGGFPQVYRQRIATDALNSLQGHAKTQKDLIEEMLKGTPDLNQTKAHEIIREAVHIGSIAEIQNGRKKSYQFPQLPTLPVVKQTAHTP